MKISRSHIGRVVEIQWADPNFDRGALETLKKGRSALATWKEYGVVYDITDGVVLIAHSLAIDVGDDTEDEIARTAVPESLIERLTVYEVAGAQATMEEKGSGQHPDKGVQA